MHIREMLIESKQKLMLLKGNITEFDQWVCKQMGCLHTREQEAVDLLYYLQKAYKAAQTMNLLYTSRTLRASVTMAWPPSQQKTSWSMLRTSMRCSSLTKKTRGAWWKHPSLFSNVQIRNTTKIAAQVLSLNFCYLYF